MLAEGSGRRDRMTGRTVRACPSGASGTLPCPGWEEMSEQIAEALVTAMALGTATINLAAGITRLCQTQPGQDEPRVRGGRHRRRGRRGVGLMSRPLLVN